MKQKNNLDPSWQLHLKQEFERDYMKKLERYLQREQNHGKITYPQHDQIFNAFNQTPFSAVKVVIIGQDPYHGVGQAHGMSFSVKTGIKPPPSLVNIYKELETDLGIKRAPHGLLEKWAHQGVLLLNSVLTVEHSKAGSHRGQGWELFTDKVIELLNDKRESLVFMLWGSPAQKKAKNVDPKKHLVLKAPHPSPLSAYRGFFGQKHFSKCNDYLKSHGVKEIDWDLNSES